MPVTRAVLGSLALRLRTGHVHRARPRWSVRLADRRRPLISRRALADARRTLAAVPSWRAPSSIGSYRSVSSVFSAGSLFSVGSFLSVGSAGSILSVGSAGSILSIGSSGSILSIGATGGLAQVGSRRRHEQEDALDASLHLAAPAPVRSIRPT